LVLNVEPRKKRKPTQNIQPYGDWFKARANTFCYPFKIIGDISGVV
jgi:hypothetical protein